MMTLRSLAVAAAVLARCHGAHGEAPSPVAATAPLAAGDVCYIAADGPAVPSPPTPPSPPDFGGDANNKMVLGYFTNWAQYRAGAARYRVEELDVTLYTHIAYAFAYISQSTYRIVPFEYNDDGPGGSWAKLRAKVDAESPGTKLLLSLGGWGFNSEFTWDGQKCPRSCPEVFTTMVASAATRATFIANSIAWCREHRFDGIDLDWEYPGVASRGGRPQDKANFAALLREFRAAIEAEPRPAGAQKLLLAAAVGVGPGTVEAGYDIATLGSELDWVGLMTYDLHGSWDPVTGHNTAFDHPAYNPDDTATWSLTGLIQQWLEQVPAEKLVLGLAAYGRSFQLANPANHGIGSAVAAAGSIGTDVDEPGMSAYYEILEFIASGATVVRDEHAGVYAYKGDQWVGYDDEQSIAEKTKWAVELGLAGVMVWDTSLDGAGNPLLTAARAELGYARRTRAMRSVPSPVPSLDRRTDCPAGTSCTAVDDGIADLAAGTVMVCTAPPGSTTTDTPAVTAPQTTPMSSGPCGLGCTSVRGRCNCPPTTPCGDANPACGASWFINDKASYCQDPWWAEQCKATCGGCGAETAPPATTEPTSMPTQLPSTDVTARPTFSPTAKPSDDLSGATGGETGHCTDSSTSCSASWFSKQKETFCEDKYWAQLCQASCDNCGDSSCADSNPSCEAVWFVNKKDAYCQDSWWADQCRASCAKC